MGRINFPMRDEELHARAKSAAALSGRKLYELVEDAIRAEVERFEADRRAAEQGGRERPGALTGAQSMRAPGAELPSNPASPVRGSVDDPEFRRRRAAHAGRAAHRPDVHIDRLVAAADSLTSDQLDRIRALLNDERPDVFKPEAAS